MTYAIFLRGINVSGKNIIPMAGLREILHKNGYPDAITYIQSGNVILSSEDQSSEKLGANITGLIQKNLRLQVPALALSKDALKSVITNNPYHTKISEDGRKVYYMLLFSKPEEERLNKLAAMNLPGEEFIFGDKVVYLKVETGMGKAKCNTNFFEKGLGVQATSRNLRTMDKLLELAAAL